MTDTIDEYTQGAQEEAWFIASMKRIRENLGWSQGELARRMNDTGWSAFHQTTISRIEKGERPVRLGEARGIASALGAFVGQMILAPEGSNAVHELELQCEETRKAESRILASIHEYSEAQRSLRNDLEAANQVDLGEAVDPWVEKRLRGAKVRAQALLDKSYRDVISERAEEAASADGFVMMNQETHGIDPEAS